MKIRALTIALLISTTAAAQELGGTWGTMQAEAEYYRIVDLQIPPAVALEAGSMCMLPDGRLAVLEYKTAARTSARKATTGCDCGAIRRYRNTCWQPGRWATTWPRSSTT